MKYYCDCSISEIDNKKWELLIDWAISFCDTVQFNVLKSGYENDPKISIILKHLFERKQNSAKLYSSGQCIEFVLNAQLVDFIKNRSFDQWRNYYFEDMSFLMNGIEQLATITHENYIIALLTEDQRIDLNRNGFSFEVEWL